MYYDVIVIGGGPSGLMAAIAAAQEGVKVLLIDKGNKLGRKLAISGGGRCNVTNRLPLEEIIHHIPGNGRFLYSAFSEFNNENIIEFFEGLGIKLKEEDHGRMFPKSEKAQSVVDALIKELKDLNVDIKTNVAVLDIRYDEKKAIGITLKSGEQIDASSIVVAVGGKSVPHTGSTGDGYAWAQKAGHTVTNLFPTEVPITSNEDFIKRKLLQGLSLRNIRLSVLNKKGKPIITHQMDMIFTHFGISGPAALRCSQFVVKEIQKTGKNEAMMSLDSIPNANEEQIFQNIIKDNPKRSFKNIVKGIVPERFLLFLLEKNNIDNQKPLTNLSHDQIRSFIKDLKHFTFTVNGTLSIEKAFVTSGGVSIKEIHPKEMESKKKEGLYFCGEILDIHGYTGGFNITAALVTGRLAGKNAAQKSLDR